MFSPGRWLLSAARSSSCRAFCTTLHFHARRANRGSRSDVQATGCFAEPCVARTANVNVVGRKIVITSSARTIGDAFACDRAKSERAGALGRLRTPVFFAVHLPYAVQYSRLPSAPGLP